MTKRTIMLMALLLGAFTLPAQSLVQIGDGSCYWVDSLLQKGETVRASMGKRTIRLNFQDIVAMADMDYGVEVLKPDGITLQPPASYQTTPASTLVGQGQTVFVPVTYDSTELRYGARKLTELIAEQGYWRLVASPEQADFLLEYHFSEKGADHAWLVFRDRMGEAFIWSKTVSARDWVPEDAGKESAETLFNTFIRNGITANNLKGLVQPSDTVIVREYKAKGPLLRGSIALNSQLKIMPQIEFGLQLTHKFSLNLGISFLSQETRYWQYSSYVENIDFDAIFQNNTAYGIPISINARQFLSSRRFKPFIEAGVGYVLPWHTYDAIKGTIVYEKDGTARRPDQNIDSYLKGFCFMFELGFDYKNFELGFFGFYRNTDNGNNGTMTVSIKGRDIYNNQLPVIDLTSDGENDDGFLVGLKLSYILYSHKSTIK